MSGLLKQSSTAQPLLFQMKDELDPTLPKLGLTPTVTIRKSGGSFASPSGAVSELANGWYQVAGNATDTNTVGPLILHATATGAVPADVVYSVVGADPLAAAVQVDLTQAIPTSNTAHTLGDALNAARAQGFGKWVKSGTTLTLYASDGTTVVHTFTLDDATNPTSRS